MGVMRAVPIALVLLAAACAQAEFFEDFSSGWDSRWVHSTESKYSGRFQVETPEGLDQPALKVPAKAKHYGLSAKLDEPLVAGKGVVLQFELKLAEGLTCGGAYLKYLTSGEFEVSGLKDDTPYTIMFGPDKCGSTNKVHLILRHKSPKGVIEEKHLKSPPLVLLDKKTHVYTAVIKPDNTYAVLIDGQEKKAGSLFEDFDPSVNPSEEIDDPEDKKPSDWVENPKMADPDATKPDDWDEDAPRQIEDPEDEKPEGWLDDEPAEIDDPEAEQPEDWDEEEDGTWEAPKVANPKCEDPGCGEWAPKKIPNPAYKGKWSAPMIDNPEYKGIWAPKKIANPDYYVDESPLDNLGAIGGLAIEIWTMDEGYYFSNILVGSDEASAAEARDKYWEPKQGVEEAQAEKEAEENKKHLGDDDDEEEGGESLSIADRIVDLFDMPALAGIKPTLQPLLDRLEDQPSLAYALLALPLLPLLLCLLPRRRSATTSKPSSTAVRKAKKGDVTGPDDATVAKTQQVGKEAAATAQQVLPTPAVSEGVAGDDDEDDKPTGVRTRARRD